jgi:hypothetical protein
VSEFWILFKDICCNLEWRQKPPIISAGKNDKLNLKNDGIFNVAKRGSYQEKIKWVHPLLLFLYRLGIMFSTQHASFQAQFVWPHWEKAGPEWKSVFRYAGLQLDKGEPVQQMVLLTLLSPLLQIKKAQKTSSLRLILLRSQRVLPRNEPWRR